jgi:hypothetical protein
MVSNLLGPAHLDETFPQSGIGEYRRPSFTACPFNDGFLKIKKFIGNIFCLKPAPIKGDALRFDEFFVVQVNLIIVGFNEIFVPSRQMRLSVFKWPIQLPKFPELPSYPVAAPSSSLITNPPAFDGDIREKTKSALSSHFPDLSDSRPWHGHQNFSTKTCPRYQGNRIRLRIRIGQSEDSNRRHVLGPMCEPDGLLRDRLRYRVPWFYWPCWYRADPRKYLRACLQRLCRHS